VRLEVYLPITLAVLVLALLVGVVVVVGVGSAGAWADMALVLLAVPLAVLLVVLTAALGGGIYLMVRLIREVPSVTSGLQDGADRLAGAVRRGSDAAVQPILAPAGVAAALAEVGRSLRSIFRAE
jgi:membrane protein implicated in regulation of membrane protease activity